jgi:hypothetical protein
MEIEVLGNHVGNWWKANYLLEATTCMEISWT